MRFDCKLGPLLVLISLMLVCSSALAETQVVMLGTGTPIPRPERSGPATAVVVDGQAYLVDAGVGIVRRAAAAAEKHEIPALIASRLNRLFLTHLHSDHTLGYPDLLLTPWVLGRRTSLVTVGPTGTREMTDKLLEAYAQDIDIRKNGPEGLPDAGRIVDVRPIKKGVVYKDEKVSVEAIPVIHGDWEEAWAFKFVTPDKTVVISGDTMPCPELVQAAKGCDILVHEVYLEAPFLRYGSVPHYHKVSHTSSSELAKMAKEIQPGLLVLYHILGWGYPEEYIIEEIREAGYKGQVVLPNDLDVF